jgi:CRP-like cAMP-binding protein
VITPKQFQKELKKLLLTRVAGMDWEDKLARVRQYIRELEKRQSPEEESAELNPSVEIIPFEPGKRPLDEALYPGHGCSERVGYLSTAEEPREAQDEVWILYRLHDLYAYAAPFNRPIDVRLSAWFLLPGSKAAVPIPGLTDVSVPPQVVSTSSFPVPSLEQASWNEFHQTAYVATFLPERDLLPRSSGRKGGGYLWSDVPEVIRTRTPDGTDPFTFANMFRQELRVDLELRSGATSISTQSIEIEVFDTGRSGSLYVRLLDQLVKVDTEAQNARLGIEDLHHGFHPWFPVLSIGMDKAMLYLRAIHQDLEQHRRNLPDPLWLLRVGLYLELLTCLGIFEAVKHEVPGLLSPQERRVFEEDAAFAPIRERLDVAAWKKVWELREIAPRAAEFFAAGPVSLTNMIRKQKTTLAFLHAHHEDLKHAIELAGPNLVNAQETWHRVFRDAERAVLKNSMIAFPELAHLEPRYRDFVLWHQKGGIKVLGFQAPESITSLFGDQDALFPSACRQYRQSMNEVAKWAAERGLMDYTGEECIPRNVSLLEAYMDGNKSLLDALQRRDGYGAALDLEGPQSSLQVSTTDDIIQLLRKVAIFKTLQDRELRKLALRARRATYGPQDRVVIQGQKDSSLFLIASGTVEVMLRQDDGRDLTVATLDAGMVFGEFALLTGEERTATVRAVGEVVLYEISKDALQPIIEARPQLIVELSLLMAGRLSERRNVLERHAQEEERVKSLTSRIRRFVLG